MMMDPYIRRCRILRVVDGDTLDCEIDLGFNMRVTERIRLLGVNAPEAKGETKGAAGAATAFVEQWLDRNSTRSFSFDGVGDWERWFILRTEKDDAFGRWLGHISCESGGFYTSLNDALLIAGHAVPWVKK